jgi:hypothetical protein
MAGGGREHIARMLTITAKDDEFHRLFRKHLILPFLHDQFLPQYSAENAVGHLFAFFKPQWNCDPDCGDQKAADTTLA